MPALCAVTRPQFSSGTKVRMIKEARAAHLHEVGLTWLPVMGRGGVCYASRSREAEIGTFSGMTVVESGKERSFVPLSRATGAIGLNLTRMVQASKRLTSCLYRSQSASSSSTYAKHAWWPGPMIIYLKNGEAPYHRQLATR